MQSAGFIGGGRVARILVGGWERGTTMPSRILIHDTNDAAFEALRAVAPVVERVPLEAAAAASVVFLALHPPAIGPVLPALRGALGPHSVLVSLAPKVTIAALQAATGAARIVRMIPNAPSLVGRGYNPVTFGDGVDAATKRELKTLFGAWGRTPEVPEKDLEAYAILTGMGPTYFWYELQALRDLGRELGLTGAGADEGLRAMMDGAVATLLDAGLTPAQVVDLIPVKPLAEVEPAVLAAVDTALPALYLKLRP
jgi:pyrroline-5-carboxylate reductase